MYMSRSVTYAAIYLDEVVIDSRTSNENQTVAAL